MFGNWRRLLKGAPSLGLALGVAAVCSPVWAAVTPQPGALNYIEGQVSINNQALTSKAVGSAAMNDGDVVSTGNGRAEILLTPGVLLRLNHNSAVRMDSTELLNTRVDLLQGQAMLEVDNLHKENNVQIADAGAITQPEKKGIYAFNADQPAVQVFDGKAVVREGDEHVDLGKGHEALLATQPLKSQKFDRDAAQNSDQLYAWSKLRSEYLSEATAASAQTFVVNAGGWYGPGWYWNPWWGMYSFVPGTGFFYNPFGFGLYSPVYFGTVLVPHYYGHYGRVYAGGAGVGAVRVPAVRGGFTGRSFAARGPIGGGFRGGMSGGIAGGFHGGRR